MPAPATVSEFLDLVRKSGVVDEKRLDAHVQRLQSAGALPAEAAKAAGVLVRDGVLTHFQAEQLMLGKWRRFTLGKYKVLERLGSGGMGSVFLCEHKLMRRRVAVKVLPTAKAADPSSLERFYREARAAAALDHPNIVHAYDIDQDETLHFLVMEYVDGASLQEIVKKTGPMDPVRAAHYVAQSAVGLEHAHRSGLVHRDIKPGNILVDRTGTVKILDMGLARFFNDEEDMLTKKYDENVLGTADYLAPEQALDSHGVDIRADVYGLGATFYFLLTGRPPFAEGTTAQKLIWHQTRQPKPIGTFRRDVPAAMIAVIEKMMAKAPAHRQQTPIEVAEALAPWTQTPIPPPAEAEMPRLSPAASGNPSEAMAGVALASTASGAPQKKAWQVTPPPSARPAGTGPLPAQPGNLAPAPPARLPGAPNPAQAILPAGAAAPRGAASTAPAYEEAGVPWEQVVSDTEELAGKGDTSPRAAAAGQPPAQRAAARAPATLEARRLWRLAALVAGGVVVLLLLLAWALGWFGSRSEPVRPPLRVSKSGEAGTFPSVRAALAKAGPQDRIVLVDPEHRERLRLDGAKGIRIEAEEGKKVSWLPPAGRLEDSLPILALANVRDVQIKGIRFDGEGRVEKLISLTGYCPGVRLEELTLEDFKKCGVAVTNCAGDVSERVELRRIRDVPNPKNTPDAALVFNANSAVEPKDNQHIIVSGCVFTGKYAREPVWFMKPRGQTIEIDLQPAK
jgi:serine/threonine protein kinase